MRSKSSVFAKIATGVSILVFFGTYLISPAQAESPKVLRIGYQKSGAFLLVRSEGNLEKALAPLGYRVEWKEFPAGPPVIEALNANSVDVGHSGDCPVILAQAAGVPLACIANSGADPESAAIVVPKNSPVRTLADLKGRKVAFDKGTSGHYLAARALASAGLALTDIQPVYLNPPNGRAAFQSGAVDAWSIWDPFFAAAEVDSDARVLVASRGFSPHREFYFARKDFLEKNPGVVAPLLAVLNETGERAMKNPQATAELLSAKLGIKLEILLRAQQRDKRYGAFPLSDEVIAEQQQVADFLFSQKIIPSPVKIADAVYHPGKPSTVQK